MEQALAEQETALTEPAVARAVFNSHVKNVFVSSSMPVRDLEFFGFASASSSAASSEKFVAANRGVSGIEGVVNSAFGFAT